LNHFKNIFAENFGEKIGVFFSNCCYFLQNFAEKIGNFFAQTAATFRKILIITLVFEKNANFFAEN
jgi:hypothetical protein